MRILIIGDSQGAGSPGRSAERQLTGLQHIVERRAHPGRGATQWARGTLLGEYQQALRTFRPQHVLLIFGVNDHDRGQGERGYARETLPGALQRLRDATAAPVWMSGPPHYPADEHERWSSDIRAVNQFVFAARFIDAYLWTMRSRESRSPRDGGLHFLGDAGSVWGVPLANELLRRIAG